VAAVEAAEGKAERREGNGPPCRRCTNREWSVETKPKHTIRWLIETLFAAPDVWIFQSESAGWPGKTYEIWTCLSCGRRARVS
jgi:hypothetical protein